MIYTEQNLTFSFPDELAVLKLDQKGLSSPHGMQFVDFVIYQKDKTYLVEVKDLFHSRVPMAEREKNIKKLQSKKEFINETFVPKARDSYTYLHLMRKDHNPFEYIVLIALGDFHNQEEIKALIGAGFKTPLESRLKKETEEEWKRQYISNCAVLTLEMWNKYFPEWKAKRIPETS
jgi:hypothetical protein